jgi:hypothetical protein
VGSSSRRFTQTGSLARGAAGQQVAGDRCRTAHGAVAQQDQVEVIGRVRQQLAERAGIPGVRVDHDRLHADPNSALRSSS